MPETYQELDTPRQNQAPQSASRATVGGQIAPAPPTVNARPKKKKLCVVTEAASVL
jgi:hypothetical protein